MKKITTPILMLVALSLPLIGACNRAPPPASATTTPASPEPETVLGKGVSTAMAKARRELETQNIDIVNGTRVAVDGHGHHFSFGHATDGSSKAQLTPQGDLLIEGKAVPVTPAQRTLLLDYRKQLVAVAEAGMSIGVQGADLAGKAVLETFSGLIHGNADEAGKRIEAEGKRIEANAMQICTRLPSLLASQQNLATSLPAFRPYATMTQADVDDCTKDDSTVVTRR